MENIIVVGDIPESSFMQLHSLEATYLNGSIVEVIGNKIVDDQGITRYVCILIPSENVDDFEIENKMKIKRENLMSIPSTTNDEERIKLQKKLKTLESKYLFDADDPTIAGLRDDKAFAASGYQEIAALYHSCRHLARMWQLKASMALVFKTGSERSNIYLQCMRRWMANLLHDVTLPVKERRDQMPIKTLKYAKVAVEFGQLDIRLSALKYLVVNFPEQHMMAVAYARELFQEKKYLEAAAVAQELNFKKELTPCVGAVNELNLPGPRFVSAQKCRDNIECLLCDISQALCEQAKVIENEGDRLNFCGKITEAKVKYAEASDLFYEAAKCTPTQIHPNERWFYAQLKTLPEIKIDMVSGQNFRFSQSLPLSCDELVGYTFIKLSGVKDFCGGAFMTNIRHVVLGIPEGWGGSKGDGV